MSDSWEIGGVIISNGVINQQTASETLVSNLSNIGAVSGDTLDAIINKLLLYVNTNFSPGVTPVIGPGLGIGSNGRTVYSTIGSVAIIPISTPFNGGISRNYGTVVNPIYLSGTSIFSANFSLKNVGNTVRAYVNDIEVGSRTLTYPTNVGTYGSLQIGFDGDPFIGTQYENQYIAIGLGLSHSFTPSSFTSGINPEKVYFMEEAEKSVEYKFFIENSASTTPSSSSGNIANFSPQITYISGIPRLNKDSSFIIGASFTNLVTEFYNAAKTIKITSGDLEENEYLANSTEITNMLNSPTVPFPLFISSNLKENIYSANFAATLTGYTARGDNTSIVISNTTTTEIDTKSIYIGEENVRVKSGSGFFPAIFGDSYDSAELLSNNYELQFIDGRFIWPTVDYTNYFPSGPNYSALNGDPDDNNLRWITQKFTLLYGANELNVKLIGTNADPDNVPVGSYRIYIYNYESGIWLSATDYYNYNGQSNHGDACLSANPLPNVSNGDFSFTVVFEPQLQSAGDLYIRVGLAQNMYLEQITLD